MFETAWTLLRGWKVLLAASVIGALAGGALLLRSPARYSAEVSITAEVSAQAAGTLNPPIKVNSELLQEYAKQAMREDALRRLARDVAGQDQQPIEETVERLRSAVSVAPDKDEARLRVSAVMSDPGEATAIVRQAARIGMETIEEFRRLRRAAIREELIASADRALKEYKRQQREYIQIQADKGLAAANVQLRAAGGRLDAYQRLLTTNEVLATEFEARVRANEELLKTVSAAVATNEPREGIASAQPAATQPGRAYGESSPDAAAEGRLSPREFLERELLRDQASLRAAREVCEEARQGLHAAVEELQTLQVQMDEAMPETTLAQRRLQSAREACAAAEDALDRWDEVFQRQFPPLVLEADSPAAVKAVGSSWPARITIMQLGALLAGSMLVLAADAHRRRAAARKGGPLTVADASQPDHAAADAPPCRLSA